MSNPEMIVHNIELPSDFDGILRHYQRIGLN
jgi:hypothetical protein